MLCGFHAGWLYWPHTLTSIWICWSLWATDRWSKDQTARNLVAVVITLALMIVGGFPFVTLLGLGAVALYVLILAGARGEHRIRLCLGMVAALTMSLAICAIPLIVFIDWFRSMDFGYRHADAGSALRFWTDAKLLLPGAAKATPSVERAMYVGMLPLLLAPVGAFMLLRRQQSVVAWLALSLVVVGATLVFQLVPVKALSWVPGLSNNPWSRAIILLDIGLAATAAWGFHNLLETFGSGRTVVTAALLACGYQSVDQITFFRLFNGPVASAYSLPADTTDLPRTKFYRPLPERHRRQQLPGLRHSRCIRASRLARSRLCGSAVAPHARTTCRPPVHHSHSDPHRGEQLPFRFARHARTRRTLRASGRQSPAEARTAQGIEREKREEATTPAAALSSMDPDIQARSAKLHPGNRRSPRNLRPRQSPRGS